MAASVGVERYCSQCGRSLVPLSVPHLSAECADCGKTVHFVRVGPDGIKVEEGERFTIPADTFRFRSIPLREESCFGQDSPSC
jgi:hypothetical protein